MFRIEFLKLKNHPQLGSINLNFSDSLDYSKLEHPYTSLIIGSNGTGKSFILKTLAEIFRQFRMNTNHVEGNKITINLPFSFHVRYKLHQNTYEILSKRLQVFTKSNRKEYIYYKNRPAVEIDFHKDLIEKKTGYEIRRQELEYPNKLLVNSIMNNDRFVFKKSKREDFYQYLGVRSTSSTASTKSLIRKTINYIYDAIESNLNFKTSLKELLQLLEFKERFRIRYHAKITKLFFSGNLNEKDFKQYFEYWWDENFIYSKRAKENPLWSVPYYNNVIKNNESLLNQLINYLNKISIQKNRFEDPDNNRSKVIVMDVLDDSIDREEVELIKHLKALDIIDIIGIDITKNDLNISISEISSGEYHLLISMIGIFANLPDNSLILIDEPEISLHPNWQMRYISFLKKVFSKFIGCQFILTTHSHFLVSDLEPDSSYLLGVKKFENIIEPMNIDRDTFGWSAEQVLLDVFNVPTTRNYFIAERFALIMKEATLNGIESITRYKDDLMHWKEALTEDDPLRYAIIKLIDKAEWLD